MTGPETDRQTKKLCLCKMMDTLVLQCRACRLHTWILVAVLLSLLLVEDVTSASTTTGRRTRPNNKTRKEPMVTDYDSHHEVQNTSMANGQGTDSGAADSSSYWLEVKAIIGGVLGFWGGVVGLGAVFLVFVISQRYCCRKNEDDKGDGVG